MDKNLVIQEVQKENVILEVKLAINKKLFEGKFITEEMYLKAKEMILRA